MSYPFKGKPFTKEKTRLISKGESEEKRQKSMHSIIRTKKHKSIGSLKSRENHTYRLRPTPNADPAKLNKNKLLFGEQNYSAVAEKLLQDYELAGNHIRKDGVLAIEYLLTASPEFFDQEPKHEKTDRLKKWCDAQVEFMKKEHGEKNILCMYLHLDEKTPHIEVYAVPIDSKGKLNCKAFLGGKNKLRDLQTRYANHNGNFGLERGAKSSKATHQQVQTFYEHIKQPAKVNNDNLQKAVKLEAPTMRNILDPDIYLKEQEARIFGRVARLFESTVYENKLIQQAKKILREWKRAEEQSSYTRYKLDRQSKMIATLDSLNIENQDLKKSLKNAEIENSLLKNRLSTKRHSIDM